MTTNNSSDYSPTNTALLVGGPDGTITSLAVGAAGQVLTSSGPGVDPVWGSGSAKIIWYQTTRDYEDGSYIFYNDNARANSVTLYKNASGVTIPAGPFNAALWQKVGSYDISPWTYNPTNTGLMNGGALTVGPALNQITVSAGTGLIISGTVENKTATQISWPATIMTFPTIATDISYYIAVDNLGALVSFVVSDTDRASISRSFIILGVVSQDSTTPANIGYCRSVPVPANDSANSFAEFVQWFVRPQFISGGFIQPIAGTLTINRTPAVIYAYGVAFQNAPNSPNKTSLAAENPLLFQRILQNNTITGSNTIEVTKYDLNGVLTNLAANKVTIQRVFYNYVSNTSYVTYGQKIYNNLDQGKGQILNDDTTFVLPSILKGSSIFCAYIVVDSTCTDLNDPAKCYIQQANGTALQGGASVVNTLEGLLDVGIANKKLQQALTWNGSLWVNDDQNRLLTWVTQTAHGFIVGDVVTKNNAGVWVKALATDLELIGVAIVSQINSANEFQGQTNGPFVKTAHGYPIGSTLYLSATAAGGVTTTRYNNGIFYTQRVAIVLDANVLLINFSDAQLLTDSRGIYFYTTGANYKTDDNVLYGNTLYHVTADIVNASASPDFSKLSATTKNLIDGSNNVAALKDYQLSFGYNNTNTYRQYLRTRASSTVQEDNGFEFLTSDTTPNGTITTAIPCLTLKGAKVYAGGWGAAYTAPTDAMQLAPKQYVDTVSTKTYNTGSGSATVSSGAITIAGASGITTSGAGSTVTISNTTASVGGLSDGPSIGGGRYIFAKVVIGDYNKGYLAGTVYKQFINGGGLLNFVAVVGNNPNQGTLQQYAQRVLMFADPGFGAIGNTLYLYRDAAGNSNYAVDFGNNAVTCRFQYEPCAGTLTFPWVVVDGTYTLIASTTPTLLTTYNEDGSVFSQRGIDDPIPLIPGAQGIP